MKIKLLTLLVCCLGLSTVQAQTEKKIEKEVKVEVQVEEKDGKKQVLIIKEEGGKKTKEVIELDGDADLDKEISKVIEVRVDAESGKEEMIIVVDEERIQKEGENVFIIDSESKDGKHKMLWVEDESVKMVQESEMELKFEFDSMEEMKSYNWDGLTDLAASFEEDASLSIEIEVEEAEGSEIELKFTGQSSEMKSIVDKIKKMVAFLSAQ